MAASPYSPAALLSKDPHAGPQGVLPVRTVRVLAFGVISLAIFACTVICLLAVWDVTTNDAGWRAISSLGIIAGGMVAFVIVNEVFGRSLGQNKVRLLAEPDAADPVAD